MTMNLLLQVFLKKATIKVNMDQKFQILLFSHTQMVMRCRVTKIIKK